MLTVVLPGVTMNAQFGRWNFDGGDIGGSYIHKVQSLIAPYGPDKRGCYLDRNVYMLGCQFFTTKESRQETQPFVTATGAVISWDGRLDNRQELLAELPEKLTSDAADLSLVAAAYRYWSSGCFSRLIGDWAVAIWNSTAQSLTLAKDPVGTRHLYYRLDRHSVTWSTILDPLVLLGDGRLRLEREYLAAWLSDSPALHLTPYVGVQSVEPSSLLQITRKGLQRKRYWDFDCAKKIHYRRDEDYEEHFRSVFAQAIRRRLRSDRPVLAELSGGMDSSSIVCTADSLVREWPALETISYFNDSDPNWDERPYFECVEKQRGRTGCHINLNSAGSPHPKLDAESFSLAPNSLLKRSDLDREFADCFDQTGARVLLSGFGGDEVMGGVTTPIPELADLLVGLRVGLLARQLKYWALNKRKPWVHLLGDTLRSFLPPPRPNCGEVPLWILPGFAKKYREAMEGYPARLRFFGPRPSFQENLHSIASLRRQLANSSFSTRPLYESRYPFLDRDVLIFICALPREQLLRPNHRRSLMRRALRDILPLKVLERKRKAFAVKNSMLAIAEYWATVVDHKHPMLASQLGIIDQTALAACVQKMNRGEDVNVVALRRTLAMECWLCNVLQQPFIHEESAGVRPGARLPDRINNCFEGI
jgi:asparagine synthase (glutamine-hydrolysing)